MEYPSWRPSELPRDIYLGNINNEKKIGITIHTINEEIDRGEKLSSGFIQRSIDDDENDIERKALNIINTQLIEKLRKIMKDVC